MNLYEAIGARVKDIRREQGFTVEQLAEAAGMSRPYLQRIEAGSKRGTVAMLARIAVALDVPLWRLFTDRQRRLAIDARRGRAEAELAAAVEAWPVDAVEALARALAKVRA